MEFQVVGGRINIWKDLKEFVSKSLIFMLGSFEHSVHGLQWTLVDVARENQILIVR